MVEAAKNRKSSLYDYLKRAILTLELQPGADLDEVQLAKQFELSRTPLRETLRQLAGIGYVELRENRGARVSEMTHMTMRNFFLVAPMVYGAILRLAAVNAKPWQIDQLKDSQKVFRQTLKSGLSADRALANNRFHEITGEMADNVYLFPSFQRLLIDHARIGMTFYAPQNNEMAKNLNVACEQHDAIIDAIEARDEKASEQLAIDHWNLSRNQIEMYVTPTSLDLPLGTLERSHPA